MKHAIILAHPDCQSFNAALAARCWAILENLGHELVVRDLYAIDFDPRLKRSEVSAAHGVPAADTQRERDALAGVDSFIFIYPFWFNAPPAILKGYVDRVFSAGFGFEAGYDGATPLLAGRTLTSISTSGAPDHWIDSTGALKTLMAGFDLHLAATCGLRVVDHIHFGDITPNMDRDTGAETLDDLARRIEALFGPDRRSRGAA
jgi:NAD(P)H dehydrogenase (quinone)